MGTESRVDVLGTEDGKLWWKVSGKVRSKKDNCLDQILTVDGEDGYPERGEEFRLSVMRETDRSG